MTNTVDHYRNLHLQAAEHPLIEDQSFRSIEEYVQHLMHLKSYETAGSLCEGRDVLDWGCNVGYGLEVLARTARSVAGLDLSERAVDAARRRPGLTAEIQHYEGDRCGFADETFDVVTSLQVLEHVSNYDTYFGEILRVLRPGGLAVFATPNAVVRLAPGMKPWNEFHVREFSPTELREFLTPRFRAVTIHGLFATEELSKVERNHVERAKRLALSTQNSWDIVRPLKARVKQRFRFILRIRDALAAVRGSPVHPQTLESAELSRFSLGDMYYKEGQLDEALDLMALCRKPC